MAMLNNQRVKHVFVLFIPSIFPLHVQTDRLLDHHLSHEHFPETHPTKSIGRILNSNKHMCDML